MAWPIHPWVDASGAPVYLLTFPKATTLEELVVFLSAWETAMNTFRAAFVVVTDLTHLIGASPEQRKAFADFDQRVASIDATYCAGAALVVRNPVVRGVVTAIYWIKPPVYPYRLFGSVAEGFAWVKERLAERQERDAARAIR